MCVCMSNRKGREGPCTSQSNNPTFKPESWRDAANQEEREDLPTPPLHEVMATIEFTFDKAGDVDDVDDAANDDANDDDDDDDDDGD